VLGSTRAIALYFSCMLLLAVILFQVLLFMTKNRHGNLEFIPHVTEAFAALSCEPNSILRRLPRVERFLIWMFDHAVAAASFLTRPDNSSCLVVKAAYSKVIPNARCTYSAQHVKHAAFQSGYCWHKPLEMQQNLPNFAD
jgi:hypothetical protein